MVFNNWLEHCLNKRLEFLNDDEIVNYKAMIKKYNMLDKRINDLQKEIDRRTKSLKDEMNLLKEKKELINSLFSELHDMNFQICLGDLVSSISEISGVSVDDIDVKVSIKNDGSSRSFYDILIVSNNYFKYVFDTHFLSENDWDRKQADGLPLRNHYLDNTNNLYGVVLFDKWDDLICDVNFGTIEFFSNGSTGHPEGLFKKAALKCLKEKTNEKVKIKRIK